MYVHMYMYLPSTYVHKDCRTASATCCNMYVFFYVRFVFMCMHVCMYVCMYVCVYVCMYTLRSPVIVFVSCARVAWNTWPTIYPQGTSPKDAFQHQKWSSHFPPPMNDLALAQFALRALYWSGCQLSQSLHLHALLFILLDAFPFVILLHAVLMALLIFVLGHALAAGRIWQNPYPNQTRVLVDKILGHNI